MKKFSENQILERLESLQMYLDGMCENPYTDLYEAGFACCLKKCAKLFGIDPDFYGIKDRE